MEELKKNKIHAENELKIIKRNYYQAVEKEIGKFGKISSSPKNPFQFYRRWNNKDFMCFIPFSDILEMNPLIRQ